MNRIHLEPSETLSSRLTWDIKWIANFESPWGIIEKIKHANLIPSKEFLKTCGTEHVKGLKSNIGWNHRELLTLKGIDDNQFKHFFGFSIKEYNKNIIDMLCKPLFDGKTNINKYFHSSLYICPTCIKKGYHSIFHQFKIIDECPFHSEKLIQACERCSKWYRNDFGYEITNKATLPFHCNCGNGYLEHDDELFPDWFRPKMGDIKANEIKRWITLNEEEISILQGTYYLHHKNFPPQINLLKKLLTLVSDTPQKESRVVFNESISYSKIKENMDPFELLERMPLRNPYQSVYNDIFLSTRQTVKAISRKIRRGVYKNHRSCLKRMKKQLREREEDKPFFCPVAFAYLESRKSVQGFNETTSVDNRGSYEDRVNEGGFDIATNIDRDLVLSMINDLIRNENFSFDVPKLEWIINRVIAHLYSHHFNNLLQFSSYKNGENGRNTYQEYTNLNQIFVVNSILDHKDKIFWVDYLPDFNKSIKKYSIFCPNKSVKQRRIMDSEKSFDPRKLAIERLDSRRLILK